MKIKPRTAILDYIIIPKKHSRRYSKVLKITKVNYHYMGPLIKDMFVDWEKEIVIVFSMKISSLDLDIAIFESIFASYGTDLTKLRSTDIQARMAAAYFLWSYSASTEQEICAMLDCTKRQMIAWKNKVAAKRLYRFSDYAIINKTKESIDEFVKQSQI